MFAYAIFAPVIRSSSGCSAPRPDREIVSIDKGPGCGLKGTLHMHRRIIAIVVMVCTLWGFSGRPAQAYVGISVTMGAPGFLLSFGQNLHAFYAPRYSAYVYRDDGLYYRWVGDGWIYSRMAGGPWWPLSPAVYLPPLLAYGPPPPVMMYRPYFMWWRMRVGPWYARMHPVWWREHRAFVARYWLWRTRVLPFYRAHPGILWRRPVGREIFTRPFVQRQMWRYTLQHPRFAARHPLLRQRAIRYNRFYRGAPGPGHFGPAPRYQGHQRFRTDGPRFDDRRDGERGGFPDRWNRRGDDRGDWRGH